MSDPFLNCPHCGEQCACRATRNELESIKKRAQQLELDMGTVEQAREMTNRAMASARAWEEQAIMTMKDRDRLKAERGEAVLKERERCARLAEEVVVPDSGLATSREIARQIRENHL